MKLKPTASIDMAAHLFAHTELARSRTTMDGKRGGRHQGASSVGFNIY